MIAARCRRVLPGLWAGMLLCVALLAAPAAFATLPNADAGRVVARIFAVEAWLSLGIAALLLLLGRIAIPTLAQGSRGRVSLDERLVVCTVACTVAGYFGVQALLPAARAGQAWMSFGQLHLFAVLIFGLKTLLALVLAWRCAAASQPINRPSS